MLRARRLVRSALWVSLLAATILIIIVAATGRPVVSYATSASMEPTIGAFDGFLVHPWRGDIAVGDIVLFESVTRGGPAVHRVVGGSAEAGWETQGDANARPDQTLGEPPVTRERILGKVVTRDDGSPILFERLGITILEARAKLVVAEDVAGGPRQLAALGFLAIALVSALPAFLGRKRRPLPARVPMRARVVLRRIFPRGILGRHVGGALLVLVCASAVFAATHAAQDVTTSLIVLQDAGAADDKIATAPGGELSREMEVSALGLMPTVVVVDPAGERVRSEQESALLGPRADGVVTIWQRAGERVGLQEDVVQVYRYPAFLPPGAIVAIHHALPGGPYLVLGAAVAALGALWFARLRIATLPVARTLRIPEDWH